MRKCLGYIADAINKAEPEIVDLDGNVLATRTRLPGWMKQPTPEFVMEEVIQQAVWSLFVNGYLRMLGLVGPTGRPAWVYVGVSPITSMLLETGQILYVYTPDFGEIDTLVANRVSYRRRFAAPAPSRGLGEMDPARTLLNTALHAQDVLDMHFVSNMMIDLVFSHDGEFVQGAGANLVEQLAKRHAGPNRSWRPLVTDRKWKVDRLKASNQASQMMELYGMVNTMLSTPAFGIDPLLF
ncbi:MAG: phage portal protein, partial [Gammaproteobacteria bacterium]|nr:phage portal protein [Gammaproteobacteria bacterium]